jgi:hypothetical protein
VAGKLGEPWASELVGRKSYGRVRKAKLVTLTHPRSSKIGKILKAEGPTISLGGAEGWR